MNNSESFTDVIAVVPAAGIGSRMQSACPKQYLTIGQKTILEHSIQSLLNHPRITQVIVALHPQDQHFATLPIAQDKRVITVQGGDSRAESVLAGLSLIETASWALVHDAARPCLHSDDLSRLLALAIDGGLGGILANPVRDTMKQSLPGQPAIDKTIDREALWHALTPQLFPASLLKQCLHKALNDGATVTDEASALEYCGYHPQLVYGRSDNIKVTRPEDLSLAEFYLSRTTNKESH